MIFIYPGSYIKYSNSQNNSVNKGNYLLITELRNISFNENINFYGKFDSTGTWYYNDKSGGISIETQNFARNLWINQYNFTNTKTNFVYSKNKILFMPTDELYQISGIIDFQYSPKIEFNNLVVTKNDTQIFNITGQIGNKQHNLSLEGTNFPLDLLAGLLNLKIPITGNSTFHVIASGNDDFPLINGRIESNHGEIYSVPYHRINALFTVQNQFLKLRDLYITAKDLYLITGSGTIPLSNKISAKDANLADLKLKLSNGNLAFLKHMTDFVTKSNGYIEGEINLEVDPNQQTNLAGNFIISNGYIELKDGIKQISDINIDLGLSKDEITIENARARIGKGLIGFFGKVKLAGFKINRYDIGLKSLTDTGIVLAIQSLSIPRSLIFKRIFSVPSTGEAVLNLALSGNMESALVKGVVELNNTNFIWPPVRDDKKKQSDPSAVPGWLKNIVWDVVLKSGNNVSYKNETIDILTQGEIKFTNSTEKLLVNGKFESVRGNANYLARNFDIRKARFEIINNEAFLEASAETVSNLSTPRGTIEPTRIMMTIERNRINDIKDIKLKFSAQDNPNIPEEKVVASVFGLGDKPLDFETQRQMLRQELARMLGVAITAPLVGTIMSPLVESGIVSNVKVTREVTESDIKDTVPTTGISIAELLAGTKTTFEKYLSRNLSVGYSMQFADRLSLWHEVELSYSWRNILFSGTIKDKNFLGIISPDAADRKFSIKHQVRFGWEEKEE